MVYIISGIKTHSPYPVARLASAATRKGFSVILIEMDRFMMCVGIINLVLVHPLRESNLTFSGM
jgi:hypothetical protein